MEMKVLECIFYFVIDEFKFYTFMLTIILILLFLAVIFNS